MKTLLVFGWRELVSSKWRAALVAFILCLQASALGGGLIAFDSLFSTRDHIYDELAFADLDVTFSPASTTEMPSLESLRAIPGVARVSRRYLSPGYMEIGASHDPLPVVVHYLEPADVQSVDALRLESGHFLSASHGEDAVVDRSFAEYHHLKLGDTLVVNPHSFAASFKVVGTALSPEYLVPTANPDMLIPNKGSLGIIYASREQLDRVFSDPLYNDIVVRYDANADSKATTAAVMSALKGLDVQRVTPMKSNFGYRYVQEILGGSRIFMPMTAMLLAFMAAIVAFISINRLIMNRRREIGGLLALGYSPRHFVLGFLVLGFVPGLIGAVLSIPGSMGFAANLAKTNAEIAGFPAPVMVWSVKNLLLAASSSVFVGLLSALLPSFSVLKMRPAHALRGGDEIRFAGLPAPIERLIAGNTSARYALRNVFRRMKLSVATVVLIALAVAMPAGLLTALASWDTWARDHTNQLHWDAVAAFKVPLKQDNVTKIMNTRGVGDYETYVQGYATLTRDSANAGSQEIRVRGLPVPTDMLAPEITNGAYFSDENADEAILNASFPGDSALPHVGEIVVVRFHGTDHTLKVVGVVNDASLLTMFVPRRTAQRIFDLEGKYSGVNFKFGAPTKARPVLDESLPPPSARPDYAEVIDLGDADPTPKAKAVEAPVVTGPITAEGTKRALLDNEMVTTVQLKSEIGDSTLRYMRGFNAIVIPFVALGGLLAFCFLMSVLGFLLLERETEYATLRTMGYGKKELATIILTEVSVLATLGLGASVGSWIGVSYLLRDLMAKAWFSVPVSLRVVDFASVAVPVVFFLLLASIPGIRAMLKLDLALVLRARAMG